MSRDSVAQDLIDIILPFLESNVTDLRADRVTDSKKWIYDDLPAPNINDTPRIAVIAGNETSDEVAVNSDGGVEFATVPTIIYIFVKKGQKIITDKGGPSETTYRDVEILSKLEKDVATQMKSDTLITSLKNIGATYTWLVTKGYTPGEYHIKTLTYHSKVVRRETP